MPDAFDAIYGQPRVRAYLRSCVAQRCVSHAYLFTGVAGSNKETAAFAFAEEILKAHEDDPSAREDIRRRVPDARIPTSITCRPKARRAIWSTRYGPSSRT